MRISDKQYQALQAEACRLAEELPKRELLDGLTAAYEAGRLLQMSKPLLVGLLGSIALRCIDDRLDDAPPRQPSAGAWPRVIREVGYDEEGLLHIAGLDDNDRLWEEVVRGRNPEGWLLKLLYVERRFGRRNRNYHLSQQPGK